MVVSSSSSSAFEGAGPGHSLRGVNANEANNGNGSGSGGTSTSMAPSPDELRAKRLAALEQRQSQTPAPAPSVPAKKSDDSTGGTSNSNKKNSIRGNAKNGSVDNGVAKKLQKRNPDLASSTSSASSSFCLNSFHKLMWDDNTTTSSDKDRWYQQGIHTPLLLERPSLAAAASMDIDDTTTKGLEETFSNWGLAQAHGGPCGILAAIQAEMLRVFKKRSKEQSETNLITIMSNVGFEEVQGALAESIASILSRAALQTNFNKDHSNSNYDEEMEGGEKVILVLPTIDKFHDNIQMRNLLTCPTNTILKDDKDDENNLQKGESLLRLVQIDGKTENIDDESLTQREIVMNQLTNATYKYLLSPSMNGDNGDCRNVLEYFYRQGGILLFTMSLVASRGVEQIKNDTDNPSLSKLTAQFGHSSQELINLLLTGQAVSNVFDNTISLGSQSAPANSTSTVAAVSSSSNNDSLNCHGIQSKPSIGYLSQLESLRYLEVGSFYKSPKEPIWVIGSTSHFSVLFGDDDCLKESESDELLEKCRRAFKSVEGGEENGFISVDSLGGVVGKLDLNLESGAIQTLAAYLEVSGAGIILWDDFWKIASRLLTGATIENVLQESNASTAIIVAPQSNTETEMSPLDVTLYSPPITTDSDEAYARKLAAEDEKMAWGTDTTLEESNLLGVAAGGGGATSKQEKTDEELARELQAQWDAETDSTKFSVANNLMSMKNSDSSTITTEDAELCEILESSKQVAEFPSVPPAVAADDNDDKNAEGRSNPQIYPVDDKKPSALLDSNAMDTTESTINSIKHTTFDFETFGDSFLLHHYNGLRGGTLTSFRVTRLSPEEAVGSSVALSSNIRSSSGGMATNSASGSGDLEDVVRTKYPSCSFDWAGKSPPFID